MPVSDELIELEMMGYEFCGNATLSAAAWHAGLLGLEPGQSCVRTVESSGADRPLSVNVTRCSRDEYIGTVSMPVPEVDSFMDYPLVCFEGISHMIVPAEAFTPKAAELSVRDFASRLGVPALGMMICSEYDDFITHAPGSDSLTIEPLVYVPGSDTVVWEHGCASGSTAVGWYRFYQDPRNTVTTIKQPGGTIRVDASDGQVSLTGRVKFRPAR